MAFPLHLDFERIMLEFDSAAFKAGEAIAPGLVGAVALARLSGNDSMKPFWLESTPHPSVHSQDTSTSSFYSAVQHIETPWRPCVILTTIMNPWHVGIEMILLPIVRVNRSSHCYNHLVSNPAWAHISPNEVTTESFAAVEMDPPWFNTRSFIGIGRPFKMRCLAKKAHILCTYRVMPKDIARLQSFRIPKDVSLANYDETLPPYPFPWIIDHYGELGTFTEECLSAGCTWNDLGAWDREHIEIATFLKCLLDAGNEPTYSDSLDALSAYHRLPVFDSASEYTVFQLATIISMPAFKELLSPCDCAALSLTHPSFTQPARKLALSQLSITTVSQAQRALSALTTQPDLLVLIDTLIVDIKSCIDEIALLTFQSLVSLVGPWLVDISLQSDEPTDIIDLFDVIGLTTGLKKLTLCCAPCQRPQSDVTLSWPPFWMAHDGLWNLEYLSLTGLTISFDRDVNGLSSVKTLKLDHCHLQYSGSSDDGTVGNDISLARFFFWWRSSLRSVELNSVTGITPESVEEAIQISTVLENIRITAVCQDANPPVSLRNVLVDKTWDTVEVTQSGFVDFMDYPRKFKQQPKQVWYGNETSWDIFGGRTHYDYWINGLHLHYMDSGDYEPFESEDSY